MSGVETEGQGVGRQQVRSHLVEVAAGLLVAGGPEAMTTRAVAAAAGVQAPTIYRLFSDKDGLMDAVAEHAYATYTRGKALDTSTDPLEDFHAGWQQHINFGLANPGVFALLAEPGRAAHSRAADLGRKALLARVDRIAAAGLLRIAAQQAADLTQAAGTGTILTLLAMPEDQRDSTLADTAYRAILAAITADTSAIPQPGPMGAAAALRASTEKLTMLSPGERYLLTEWLDRITQPPSNALN